MWTPKTEKFDIYINKPIKIYYVDDYFNKDNDRLYIKKDDIGKYEEGILKNIYKNKQNIYSIVFNKSNKESYTISSNITKKVAINLLYEIQETITKICLEQVNQDISSCIINYVYPFIEI
tara:strand:+ start:62 stop:421 length:360 start_codon:yes stop_codon:yes gene_type:complete